MASQLNPQQLPLIDLAMFEAGDLWRDHLAAQLDRASRDFGAFILVGHGIDNSLADELLSAARRASDTAGQQLSGTLDNRSAAEPARRPEFSGDLVASREYATALTGLGHKLMSTLGRALGVGANYFVDHVSGEPSVQFRIVAHAPGPLDSGAAASTGLLTIRALDESEALQIRHGAEWISVPAIPDAFVVSLGDALVRLTNGRYTCAAHRVRPELAGKLLTLRFRFDRAANAALRPVPEGVSGAGAFALISAYAEGERDRVRAAP